MRLAPHFKDKGQPFPPATINNGPKCFVAKHKVGLASFSNYFASFSHFDQIMCNGFSTAPAVTRVHC